jgi:hypothetical protein
LKVFEILSIARMLILAAHVLASLILLATVATIDGIGGALFVGIVAIMMTLPIALLVLSHKLGWISLLAAVLLSLSGLYLYWRAFFGPDIDAQSGLMLIFVPLYQLLVAFVIVGLRWIARELLDSEPK